MGRVAAPHIITDDSALGGTVIERSLRFNRNDNAYLSRTPSSAGNRKTFTYSAWVKLGQTGINSSTNPGNGLFLSTGAGSNAANMALRITNNGYIGIDYYAVGGYYSTGRLRDPSAWYHCVWVMDTTESTAANRMKVYVNGELFYNNSMSLSQNADTPLNNNSATTIGVYPYNVSHPYRLDAHLAEVNFIDGQALTPSSFGYTESQTGIWKPKRYEGTYGANGFHLEFKDNSSTSALGKDTSGNGNDFTTNNFSVSAGAGNDSVEDTPTNNWCTLNPLAMIVTGNVTPSNGNLDASFGTVSGGGGIASTFAVSSGKWYWEIKITATSSARIDIGVVDDTFEPYSGSVRYAPGLNSKSYAYVSFGTKYNNNTDTSYGATYGTNDVIGIALDLDNGTITFYKNNVSQGQAFSGLTGGFSPAVGDGSSAGTHSISANFGQQGFTYTPPTGFKALNSANLPSNVPSIINPQKHFKSILYVGNNATNVVTGLGFKPDLVWIKNRSLASDHLLSDSVRGLFNIRSNTQNGDQANSNIHLQSFDSNGFTVAGTGTNSNSNGHNFVAWCWKAGGAAVSNSDGSITSSVSANQQVGFSIVSYTGTGSVATIGHGLGKKPDWIIVKNRTDSNNWNIYHSANGANYVLYFTTGVRVDQTSNWNDTEPTSSVFTVGTSNGTNGSSDNMIAYCWAEIPGYSKFGSYTGNGSTDGAYVHLGFRPAWVMIKNIDATDHWNMTDSTRFPTNVIDASISANLNNAEGYGGVYDRIDYLSNGFKYRQNNSQANWNGQKYIYMAFAEQPGITPYDTQTNAR